MWVINRKISISGSVIIVDGGSLLLRKSTLTFVGVIQPAPPEEPVSMNLTVKAGGALSIFQSTITSDRLGAYFIYAENGSYVEIFESKICNAGYKTQRETEEYKWIGPAYTNDVSKYGHGIELEVPVYLKNNVFVNVTSIRFYASNNIVENNTVINLRHEGFAFMSTSTNNVVRFNRILNASVDGGNPEGYNFDRETHGIRFYPPVIEDVGSEIYGNVIQNVTYGISMSWVSPWTARTNMKIHDNHVHHTIVCLGGVIKSSTIFRELYENYWHAGIYIEGENVIIKNNIIRNATFGIPYVWSEDYRIFVNKTGVYGEAYFDYLLKFRVGIELGGPPYESQVILYNCSIFNNVIEYIPAKGAAINTDIAYLLANLAVFNNTFRHIADKNYAYPAPVGVRHIIYNEQPGGVIQLEHVDNVTISNNLMEHIAQGITNCFVDAISFRGIINIENNVIVNASSYAIRFELTYVHLQPPTRNYTIVIRKNTIIGANRAIAISNDEGWLNKTIIRGNRIINCDQGLQFGYVWKPISNCTILENTIINSSCAIRLYNQQHKIAIHHNNFINYTQVVLGANILEWDDGYPSGGNYWSDYIGVDVHSGSYQNETGSDGIGDTPKIIGNYNKDNYPLMAPLSVFDGGVWDGVSHTVHIISNSTVSDFKIDIQQKIISFNVAGTEGTAAFCRVTIPNAIVQRLWQGNYTVLLNGEPWPYRDWKDSSASYIYVAYTHSDHQIAIVYEFPSAILLLAFLAFIVVFHMVLVKPKPKSMLPRSYKRTARSIF
ncbi:MAG: NosD domain-containing protein [Candidatus Bathyarchaeia archaeon]